MGLFDNEYLNTFNQQSQSDNLHAETGENSQRQSGMSGQIRNTPKTGTSTVRRTRMIGYHDPVTPENSPTMKHLVQMGLADDSDNVHAQQDATGQSYGKSLTNAVNNGAAKVGKQVTYGMKLNADEHLSRAENPVPEIVKKGIDVYGKSQAEHQDESAALLLKNVFEKMRHDAVSDTITREMDTTANGKDKLGIVIDAFKNEFVTKPQIAFWSTGTMAGDAGKALAPEGSIDNTALNHAEAQRDHFQRQSDRWEDQSMHLNNIPDINDPEKSVENLSQKFYEDLGSKVPYAVAGAFRPFVAGAPIASRLFGASMFGTAQNHSRILQDTGKSNYPKAMLGGAINAAAGQLPYLKGKYNPAGDSIWGRIIMNLGAQAIKQGNYWWMHNNKKGKQEE